MDNMTLTQVHIKNYFLSFMYSLTAKTISSYLLSLLLLFPFLPVLLLPPFFLLIPILLVLVLVLPLVLPIIYLLLLSWNRCYHQDP